MKILLYAAILAAAAMLALPTGSDSCSIAPPAPVFATTHRPADIDAFVAGRAGVIWPSYDRSYLVGAYRALSGRPLSADEATAFYPKPKQPVPAVPGVPAVEPVSTWTQARSAVPGVTRADFLNTFRAVNTAGSFLYYPNCLDDAFTTAAHTLAMRIQTWGKEDARVRDWVEAQDRVFSNCPGNPAGSIPAEPTAGMDPLLAADRHYQIAAAYFYAADWENARKAFEQVAQDASSPWKTSAPYLIARTYLREATVENKPEALAEAARRFQAIIDDPAQQAWHEASRKLLEYTKLRTDPYTRLAELGTDLSQPGAAKDPAQELADFLYLLEHAEPARAQPTSDLADWLLTFERHVPDEKEHSLAQWQKTHSQAWLIAALTWSNLELLPEARHADPASPGFESLTFYGLTHETDINEQRNWADEALRQKLQVSTRNLILAERLKVARDWPEFLRFAPRRPEAKLEEFDGSEVDAQKPPVPTGTAPLFDVDSTGLMNARVPFSLWRDATRNPLLPAHLRLQVTQSAWVRAFALHRDADARELMKQVVAAQPSAAEPARDFLNASDTESARFAAVFLLLRSPELSPFLEAGSGTPADLTKIHHLGDIEWGFAGNCSAQFGNLPGQQLTIPQGSFLTESQKMENQQQWQQLAAEVPSGGGFLAAQTFAWAKSHPQDPRLPEALHLVVQAGRRACRENQEKVTYGRQAFILLHRQYPDSEWATKTKYWYE